MERPHEEGSRCAALNGDCLEDTTNNQPSATLESQSLKIPRSISIRGREALQMLVQASEYALNLNRSVWDFAMEIEYLRDSGLAVSDLRWLVCAGILEQAREVRDSNLTERSFVRGPALVFSDSSCFALTTTGYALTQQWLDEFTGSAPVQPQHNLIQPVMGAPATTSVEASLLRLRPSWDRDRQELRVANQVVKQFKVPAPNQEIILAAFHEENWPVRIDDPLPPRAEMEPKRRLHDTIVSLNRNQRANLIRFLGDGSGSGVRWQFVAAPNGHGL